LYSSDQTKQIEELKRKLADSEAKNRDLGSSICQSTLAMYSSSTDIVKKQAAQNAEEYDRLATRYNEATGQTSNKKSD
jgi:B-cell receptor-associated protein 31